MHLLATCSAGVWMSAGVHVSVQPATCNTIDAQCVYRTRAKLSTVLRSSTRPYTSIGVYLIKATPCLGFGLCHTGAVHVIVGASLPGKPSAECTVHEMRRRAKPREGTPWRHCW